MLKSWSIASLICHRLLLVSLPLLFSISVWAWPPTYGAEFEFYKPGVEWGEANYNGKEALETKAEFTELVRQACGGCRELIVRGKFGDHVRFILPSGYWLTVTHDLGVVEILTKPATLEELRSIQPELDRILFRAAKAGGFRIDLEDTAHFNFGAKSAFGDNPKDFLRFFVDYQNHAHLALGSLGQDLGNAAPLSALGDKQRNALKVIIDQAEKGRFTSLSEIADEIRHKVYTMTYDPEFANTNHYQAVGLKYLTETNLKEGDRPVELRAIWAQANMNHFIRIAELIEARLNYLKTQNGPIIYRPQALTEVPTWEESTTRFFIYVTEAGLDFEKFKMLLPKEGREAPLADFLNADLPAHVRLKSLDDYRDMILISAWFRDFAENLIQKSGSSRSAVTTKILEDIKSAREQSLGPVDFSHLRCQRVHLSTQQIIPPAQKSLWNRFLGL